MILSDESIADAIDEGRITLDPSPTPSQIQPASLDIRIGDTLYDPVSDEPLGTLSATPGKRYHAYTKSRITLPDDIAALMTGRSSIGRKGATVHITAGWIDPGWDGKLLYEIKNTSAYPIHFEAGSRIAQLIFFPTDHPTSGYSGQFQGQDTP